MSRNRIWTVSAKGGVGKSTLCVNLSRAIAAMGQRVLLVDLDTTCRTLDMLLGVENTAIYDISDVLKKRVGASTAAVRLPQSENMYLLCGAMQCDLTFPASALEEALTQAERDLGITVTLIDTHAPDRNAAAVASVVTDTLVITTPDTLSLRAAEACGLFLQGCDAPRVRLAVNRFRFEEPRQPSLRSMIDTAGLRLIGVIPEDPEMAFAQEKGILAKESAEPNTVMAFRSLALRYCGETVPLFSGFRGIDRRKYIT